MKKRKTRISGEVTSTRQSSQPVMGPTCQEAFISWPLSARTPTPAANVSQNATATTTSRSRLRIARPPPTISTSARTSQGESGPHQNASGSARSGPSSRKQRTSPKFDGLKTWRPRNVTRCFERRDTAAVPAKIHQPFMLHQSPCSVPGTRRTNATPLPVRSALAGQSSTRCRRKAIATSRTALVRSATRICAIDRSKSNAVWPSTCSVTITPARWSRGSRSLGSSTGYVVPRIRTEGACATSAELLTGRGIVRPVPAKRAGYAPQNSSNAAGSDGSASTSWTSPSRIRKRSTWSRSSRRPWRSPEAR